MVFNHIYLFSLAICQNCGISIITTECGVQQGWVLGPILYFLTPLIELIASYKPVKPLLYSNVTHIYLSVICSNASNSGTSLYKKKIKKQLAL